ncbi:MFS transporter [Hyphomicrobium facile]|uniref:MFS transporter, UMF1 family n=1 Tax=Hyphomicrobium facile TaxID=51670 RepID=A0A1I7NTS8_9HYPH|nr:MFS transporter [Hyphomicrobium facile]SFV38071.1 MFS transporter, UMF1 family [Hyphomicrobium facile]
MATIDIGGSDEQASAVATGDVVRAPLRARVSWMLYDWAVQPHYTLVQTFLFGPYFANAVVQNSTCGTLIAEGSEKAACGQALWGYAAAVAGLLIAILSPLLGAAADGRGSRKPWMACLSLVFLAGLSTLWLGTPDANLTTILIVLAGFVMATLAAELMSVFSNAIMTGLVPRDELGRLSGTGWAVGYFGGLVSLALVAGLLVPIPGEATTLLGLDPLLKLDGGAHQGDRITGPFAAIWFAIFIIPFFLFVPDRRRAVGAHPERSATAELWDTIKSLPAMPSVLIFLIARMLYTDGLTAIFAFGGIYGASVFGWGPLELGIFGIVLTLVGAFGALFGGWLDDRLGPKTVIVVALLALIAGALGILSVDKNHILYTTEVAEKVIGATPFSSPGEQVFLAFAILVGVVAAPVQAASRSLLARIAPPEKITQFFGLFAFSGKVTAFLAPLAVAFVTLHTGSQRIGMSAVLAFLAIGALMMLFVRTRPAR